MLEHVALLDKSPLFAALAPAHRQQIAGYLTRHEIPTGKEIVREGEPGDGLYLLGAGAVGVFARDPRLGTSQLLATLEPPESFGEVALASARMHGTTCTALRPSVVFHLAHDVFLAVATQSPVVALALAD